MMTSLILALALTSLKIEAPQYQAPKMQLDLPGVPKAEGLSAPSAKDEDLTAQKAVATDTMKLTPASVEELQLSKSFVATARGLKALEPVDTFLVATVPAQLPTFKACVRVSSPDKMPTRVKVQLKLPGGAEFVSFSKNISFEKDWAEVVFDFTTLKVEQGGVYKVVVSLDGAPAAELPLEIKQAKQAAQSSGR
jgi:hypothetical protein